MAAAIRMLIPVRDAVCEVLKLQEQGQPYEAAQVQLSDTWSAFVEEFGPINLTKISSTSLAKATTRLTAPRTLAAADDDVEDMQSDLEGDRCDEDALASYKSLGRAREIGARFYIAATTDARANATG